MYSRMVSRLGGAGAMALATLATTAGADVIQLMSTNPEVGGFFGTAVSSIPDLNGDGIDDVIIGASTEDGGGVADAGRVYIFSGANGAFIRAHSSENDTNGGRFGGAVAGVRDLNNDGAGDYVVGARGELNSAGRVYVYSGANGAHIRTHTSPNSENFGRFGDSVAGIDDLTGDGRGDYIVGAPEENSDKGNAYVYSGGSGALWRSHFSPNAENSGQFGYAVAGVPDSNNDNRGDYVIGAPYEGPGAAPSGAGRAYHFDGLTGSLLHTLASPNQQSNGFFGWSVGGTPDVGGNGSGDIMIGAPYEGFSVAGDFKNNAGRAYLFSGTTGALGHTFREADADVDFDHFFGMSVDGLEDLDGDGLGDLVVGASGAYDVYVYKGTGTFEVLQVVHTPDGLGINQFYGSAVARLKDSNGDGKGDFIIGGPGSDDFPNDPSQNGRAWIHRANLVNNACTSITVQTLVDGPNEITNIGANGGGTGATDCLLDLQNDVWYRYVATCDGDVSFSTCNANEFDTIIAVYTGCSYGGFPIFACQLTTNPLVCNDDTVGCSLGSVATVAAVEGQCFFVRVGGFEGAQGIATLTVTCDGCDADLDNSGSVDGGDITILLGNWGTNGLGDLSGNGNVGGEDITILLGAWGPC